METEYLEMFLQESQEHLQALNQNVLILEQNTEDINVVGEIFRSAHTFKGMAATMGFTDLTHLTHEMENVLDLVRNSKLSVDSSVIDIIFECIDSLEQMVIDIQSGGKGHLDVKETVEKLKSIVNSNNETKSSDTNSPHESEFTSLFASHYIQVTLREDCLMTSIRALMVIDTLSQIGEILETIPAMSEIEQGNFGHSFKIAFSSKEPLERILALPISISEVENVELLENTSVIEEPIKKEGSNNSTSATNDRDKVKKTKVMNNQSIRVNIDKIESLLNMFEETVVERGRIEEIASKIKNPELNERLLRLANVSKELQNIVLNMRMVPVEIAFNRFPRMVRSLAKDLGKSINLIIEGEETEIDRMVIDEIGDPLVHLIRNSVDHGIEPTEERIKSGKDGTGTVRLEAFHSGNNVVIQITDDGKGINKAKVIEKAIKNNIISSAESLQLSDNQVYDLLFQPGFSTAEVISDISGRGVGLDVVKTTITKIGGSLTVKSEEGKGSVFRIELPLTLTIIQSMLVEVNKVKYAMPLGGIVESIRISPESVHSIQDKYMISYRDKTIQLLSLNNVFYKTDTLRDTQELWMQIIIVKSNDALFAIQVDEIIGQREIVLKSLGKFFKDCNNYFSGATILGDGNVVLIMDIDKVL